MLMFCNEHVNTTLLFAAMKDTHYCAIAAINKF
ncbi:hypothetical protein LTSEALA_2817 [Salmonella enterica subsp. enterica serovar Alachua str. R6-377]|uniref:Uncharacterized protein n=1 Tax=Salmonella enterica subsp. enterica serovar Alachua str. R6-377 TaxID=913241 RepID=G5LPY5_SALET|nr:hypothetical protein LTSEALA_2817 [Salmonella enterica subsp. enterica serovar Alachua str. R6-377]